MISYNSNDFSPNIDCWEKFVCDGLVPTDEEVMEIIKESDSDPLPENVYQEILLMRVENKLVRKAVEKVKYFLNHFNSVVEKKVSIPKDFEMESQIESTLNLNYFINCRNTSFYVKIPYFNGNFKEFCDKNPDKYYGNYSEDEEVEPTKSEDFDDLINIIAFHYCYDKLYYLFIEDYDFVGELNCLSKLLEE